ncbi:MAG TPA: hypothetical protein VMS76_03910 [Planctomycetota bacterium]|nr:hypothetical protein [Planctomycetota bacterium]
MNPAILLLSSALALVQGAQPAPEAPAQERLVPGELPASAAPQARLAWERMCQATALDPARARVEGFVLTFDATVYSKERQSNDLSDVTYRYLEPGWVRMSLASDRERMRGPEGDFVVEKGRSVSLKGREYDEDRRELDQTLAVMKSFVGLTDPRSLRVASLERMGGPPSGLPALLHQTVRSALGKSEVRKVEPQKLVWLQVVSPDLRRSARAERSSLQRARVGLDPETHLPLLAVLSEERSDGGGEPLLVELFDFRELDGYRVPFRVRSYLAEASAGALRYGRPSVELWLKGGTLRPKLTPKDFLPSGK